MTKMTDFTARMVENGWIVTIDSIGSCGTNYVFATMKDLAEWLVADPDAAREASAVADLQAAFDTIDQEQKHYLCNGRGWCKTLEGEECGPCPDCPPEVRAANMPASLRNTIERVNMLLASKSGLGPAPETLCAMCADEITESAAWQK